MNVNTAALLQYGAGGSRMSDSFTVFLPKLEVTKDEHEKT